MPNILVSVVENDFEEVKKDFLNLSKKCRVSIQSVIKNQIKDCAIEQGKWMNSNATSDPNNMSILYYTIGNRSGEKSLRIFSGTKNC